MWLRLGFAVRHQYTVVRFLVALLSFHRAVCDFTLTIVHTNDVHARVGQTDTYSSQCKPDDAAAGNCYAGVARRHTKIQQLRDQNENVLLLDAGDQFQGTLWFTLYGGLEASHFMNVLGYDAMCLGNHEFDNGVDGLVSPFLANVTFPVLCANLDTSNEPRLNNTKASVIKTLNGQNVAIVGYVTKDTPFLTDPDGVKTVKFNDEIESVRAEVDRLKEQGHDKILVLGHGGYEMDKDIAKAVDGVDVVIGGHSNTFLYNGEQPSIEPIIGPYPTEVSQSSGDKALVATAYVYGKYLGFLQVTFDDNGKVKGYSGNPILLDATTEEDPVVKEMVQKWAEPGLNYTSTIVGETYVFLLGDMTQCRLFECNLGNLITDAVLYEHIRKPDSDSWADVSIVVWNGGGIRASIPQGMINIAALLEAFPFGNEVEMIKLKGRHVREMFEHSVSAYNPVGPAGRFLQVSGVRVVYDIWQPVNRRVRELDVKCTACSVPKYEPLVDDNTYSLLTSNFLIKGGDGYDMILDNVISRSPYGTVAIDVLTAYLGRHSPITLGVEERIIVHQADNGTSAATSLLVQHSAHGLKLVCAVLLLGTLGSV